MSSSTGSMEKEGLMMKGRAIIDTRPPFRSVKEAVALFGERVLVGEIYAKQLKEIQTKAKSDKDEQQATTRQVLGNVTTELEETKENLKKAREEGNYMVNCLKSLKDELEQTKRELRQLKAAKEAVVIEHPSNSPINPEIEELKFVETNNNNNNNKNVMSKRDIDVEQHEIHKKKFVSFASPPSLTRDIMKNKNKIIINDNNNNNNNNNNNGGGENASEGAKLGRTPSFRKDGKKKPVVPIVGWLFSRKNKKDQYEGSARSPRA